MTGLSRFMCNIPNLKAETNIDLDCFDYCGTIDEENNIISLRFRHCYDVGCSGAETPNCTDKCRLDYSSCSAGPRENGIYA